MLQVGPPKISRSLLLGLLVVSAAFIAGCGGGDSEPDCSDIPASREWEECMGMVEPEKSSTDDEPDSTSNESNSTSSSDLSKVGTITGTGGGTEIRNTFRLGPLLYSDDAPPSDVLSACLVGSSSEIASSVFAQGEVDVEYSEGSLPLSIPLNTELVQEGGLLAAFTAYELDGEWLCGAESAYGRTFELEPGELVTLPFWVVATGRLTNAQPELPDDVLNAWYFDLLGELAEQEVSGPGKVYCEDESEDRLMLYNRATRSTCS